MAKPPPESQWEDYVPEIDLIDWTSGTFTVTTPGDNTAGTVTDCEQEPAEEVEQRRSRTISNEDTEPAKSLLQAAGPARENGRAWRARVARTIAAKISRL